MTVFICLDIAEARLDTLNVVHRRSQPLTFVVIHRTLAFLAVKRRDVNGASGRLTRLL